MKNKEKLNILILCSVLFLSGCGASDAPQSYEESDISMEEPEEKTVFTGQEESEETEDSEMFKLYQELVESAQYDWEWVIEPGEYEDFTFLGGTYIAVKKENGKYSVIDGNGDFVFPEEYDYISPYSENMAHAENDGNIFYLDEDGNRVIQGTFQSARSFYGQRAAVQMDGKWGFINPDGEVVIECQYEEVNAFQEGYAAVKNKNGWGFIDSDGKMTVPCQYDEVKDYSEGLAAVEKDGKWGYIDRMGQNVIELMYDDAGSFSEGKAPVEQDNYYQDGLKAWAYINPENAIVIDWFPCYGGVAFREYAGEFHDGLAFVLREIPTIINENGEEVFESYFFISDYVYDSKYQAIPAYVFTDDLMTKRKYGLVGLDGNCLIEPVFDWVWEPCGDYVRVEMTVEGKRCEGAIRIKEKAEVYRVEETGSQEAEPDENGFILPDSSVREIGEQETFEIIDIIWGEKYYVALCGDGSVRQWSVSEEREDAVIVGGIYNAVKIMSMGAGRVFYALAEDGALYMWGENEYVDTNNPKWGEERQKIYEDRAVSVFPGDEFVLADATDKQAFAINKEGKLYTWGDTGYRFFYSSDEELDHEYHLESDLVKGTERIFTGADLSHYFIREDGSVYMLRSWHSSYGYIPWIYPGIGRINTMLLGESDFIVFGRGGLSSLYLYELGETDIGQIAADKYAVFLYGEDGVLRYWDSYRVKYHDCVEAVYRPSGPGGPWLDVNGDYVEADINEILGRPERDTGRIVDMCACDENVLFLMETGEVFMSSYQTYDQEEVEYWIDSTNPYRTEYTRTVELELKQVVFVPLEWKNIVKLNSDGDSHFTAVDCDGNYYVLDTSRKLQLKKHMN